MGSSIKVSGLARGNVTFKKARTNAQQMIDHNVGVTPVHNYEIKRIDSDYFVEE
jgi:restriction endonuclease Mrr